MKITNKYGLPESLVRACRNDSYSRGDCDYSVSDLITPPRVLALKRKHFDELEEDVSDRVWSIFGQAVHLIAERAGEGTVERRLFWKILDKTISGQMDYYDKETGILSDYKVSTVSKFSYKDFSDWERQQNCYAQLLRWHKEKVTKLQIVAFTRDHRPREAEVAAKTQKPYPEKAFTIELPLWPEMQATSFITNQIIIHESAKERLPLCSALERWAKPDSWAVKKLNQKNAVSGHADHISRENASRAAACLGQGHYIEYRPGRNTRCESYCAPSKFCDQFKELKKLNNQVTPNGVST